MVYSIVEFENDNVCYVPTEWVFSNNEKCYWPSNNLKSKLNLLRDECFPPKKDVWDVFTIKRIFGTASKYY